MFPENGCILEIESNEVDPKERVVEYQEKPTVLIIITVISES